MKKDKLIGISKVGKKGQIVIPKEAREMFHIMPGDSMIVLCDKEKGIALLRRVAIRKFWFILTASTHLDNEKIRQYDKYSLIFVIANLSKINQNELHSTSNSIFLCKKKAKAAH